MKKTSKGMIASLLLLAIASCGSGDGTSGNITGVAATGNAISGGIVTLKCAGGLGSATTTTNADGSYSFAVRNITLPCLTEVSFTDSNSNAYTLHSYVSDTGTSNITPLTDLLLAALFLDQPADIFDEGNFRKFTDAEKAAALTAVKTSLQAYGINLPADLDPIRDSLIAKTATQGGNEHDQILDAMGLQLSLQGTQSVNITLQMGGTPIAVSSGSLSWGSFYNGGSTGGFFSGSSITGTEYLTPSQFLQGDPAATLSNYMASHTLVGTYNGTFGKNGGSCSFTVNADASVSSGFILPVEEGDNATTSYLIPASAFRTAWQPTDTTWTWVDELAERSGALAVIEGNPSQRKIALALMDSHVAGMESCVAPLARH